ncbi:MAG TPA: PAS domain S-box protein [Spirochaetota bacterium]|nr:PAS domain S-box protein [Spirochaetota bacterium]
MADEMIMIVEDEELVALEMGNTVSSWGYGVITVRSGEEALRICGETRPPLALMDIRLKGPMDGIETATRLREHCNTAVIFVTAYSDSDIIERAKHTMPFGFLVKPVEDRELRASIETALYMHSVESARRRAEEDLRASRDGLELRVQERTRELQQANELLRESEERYRALFENARVGIGIVSMDGDILAANPVMAAILGHSKENMLSMSIRDFYVEPANRDILIERLRDLGQVADFETAFRHKNGSIVYVNFNVNKITWNGREALHKVMEDITERKQALDALIQAHAELDRRVVERTADLASANRKLEEEIAVRKRAESSIKESEERYRTVADFTFDWEFWITTEGRLLYVSPSCERITGYTRSEFIDDPGLMMRIVHPDDADMVGRHMQYPTGISDDIYGIDFRIIRKDGGVRWIGHRCQAVFSDEGRHLGRRGSHRDITSQKRAEEEVTRLNRHIITLQEQERQRVAKDLHDGVSQMMNAAKLNFAAFIQDTEKNRERFDTGMEFMDLAGRELREVYSNLYPSVLEDLGLAAAVRLYTKKFLANRGIDAEVTIDDDLRLPVEVQVDLYRIIQESCSNITRHSGATLARLELKERDGLFTLRIYDNGAGFDPDAPMSSEGGFGIINMKQRVKHLDGSFELETGGSGTRITITIPGGEESNG